MSLVKLVGGSSLRDMYGDMVFVFVGEIPNMPGHCVASPSTGDAHGMLIFGYHTDNFIELSEDET